MCRVSDRRGSIHASESAPFVARFAWRFCSRTASSFFQYLRDESGTPRPWQKPLLDDRPPPLLGGRAAVLGQGPVPGLGRVSHRIPPVPLYSAGAGPPLQGFRGV